MIDINIYESQTCKTVSFGRKGENLARRILFDLSALIAEFGAGTFEWVIRRPHESTVYIAVNKEQNGNTAILNLTTTETAISGYGGLELRYYVDDVIVKTIVWRTSIAASLGGGDVPDPIEDYIDQMREIAQDASESADAAGESATQAAVSAANAANSATEAAGYAAQAAESASASANSATDSAASASAAYTSETNAANSATQASDFAIQAANSASAASGSASQAASSVTQAAGSASAAANSATQAAQSATAAAQSATAADQSAQDIAASSAQIQTNKDDITDLKNNLSDIGEIVGIRNVNFTEIDGSFISANGGISDSPTFSRSAPVSVSKGDVVKFNARGYSTSVAMISLVNADGTNIRPQVISEDSTVRPYTYTVAIDGYIAVSYNKNYEHTLTIESNKIDALEDTVESIMSTEEITPSDLRNGYIHRDGRFMSANNFRCTYPIRLENETITFVARGYTNIVSLLCLCDANGENRINLVNSTEENPQQTVTYTSDGVSYIIISSGITVPIKYTLKKINQPIDVPYVSLSMFEHFGVIGDSYASGALFFNNSEKDDYAHSWGQIMARNLGTTCTNYSKGGLSTRTWLTDNKGLSLMQSSDPENIYYLALGINDYYSLGDAYLGAITDITSHSSYTEYPDTFYGNYGKIIEQIQAHAPNAKMVLFTIAAITPNQTRDAYNSAIIEIANHYGIPYIVQNDDSFFMSDFFNKTKVEGHPIAITYSGMASAFERLLIDCIKTNVNYFKNTYWYD